MQTNPNKCLSSKCQFNGILYILLYIGYMALHQLTQRSDNEAKLHLNNR